jgi:hypothetical protein
MKMIPILIAGLLLLCFVHSAIALDIYEYETTETGFRVVYEDGSYGNIDINTTDTVFNDWKTYWNISIVDFDVYNESMIDGVQMGAYFESSAEVRPIDDGDSVVCSTTMYYAHELLASDFTTYNSIAAVPTVQFYTKISNRYIMNGAQEMWYRSPVGWDEENFYNYSGRPYYFLNVYDSEGTLVYAGRAMFVYEGRIYFKLNFKFYSDERYKFIEGSRTIDTDPISLLTLYFANNQDIGSDEETDSYIFPGTDQARKFEDLELSWSMVFQIGIGLAGTEKLIHLSGVYKEGNNNTVRLVTQDIYGSVDDVDYINVSVPFRMTKATDLTVKVITYSGVGIDETDYFGFDNITGIFRATIPITDPDALEINRYKIEFNFVNLTEEGHYLTYTMIPTTSCYHKLYAIRYDPPTYERELLAEPNFAVHLEIGEGVVVEPFQDQSIRIDTVLIGIAMIVIGIFITAFAILHANIPLAVVGIGLIAGGSLTVYEGWVGIEPGSTTVANILRGIADGAVVLGKAIIDGVSWLRENLWNAIVWLTERLAIFGAGLMTFFDIIVDFFFFVLFMVVVWIWAKFLKIMDGVVAGDMDKALATTSQMITKPTGYIQRRVSKGARLVLRAKGRRR